MLCSDASKLRGGRAPAANLNPALCSSPCFPAALEAAKQRRKLLQTPPTTWDWRSLGVVRGQLQGARRQGWRARTGGCRHLQAGLRRSPPCILPLRPPHPPRPFTRR